VQVFYEPHAVPVSTSTAGSFATIAAAIAANIPGPVQTTGLVTEGYYAAGDGGGAFYRYSASQPGHPGKFQSADGAWWELVPGAQGVNVKSLGAKGDAATDDSTSIANAILMARVMPIRRVYAPAATYKVTKSLDFTYGITGTLGLNLFGDGSAKTVFDFSAMTEAYPGIDFTGNQQGVARGWTAQINGNASLATALFLAAKNSNNFSGNSVILDDVRCVMPPSGFNANNYAAIVVASSDRALLRNVYGYGPRGLYLTGHRPSAVASKFQGHSTQIDWTQCDCDSVVGIGSLGGALITSGALKFSGANYFALVASGGAGQNPAIIDIYTESAAASEHGIYGYFRTENQTGVTGIAAIRLRSSAQAWQITGDLTTDAVGPIIIGPGGIGSSTLAIDTSANAPLFDATVKVSQVQIVTGSISNLGTPDAASSGIEVFGGGITPVMLRPYKEWSLRRNDGTSYRSGDTYLNYGQSTATIQETGMLTLFAPANPAYTGGSGEQLHASWTIPANLLTNYQALGGRLTPPITYQIRGSHNGGAAGRVRINLAQGANSSDVYDSGAALAAGNAEFTIDLAVLNLSTSALRANTAGFAGGARAPSKTTNIQSVGFVPSADITVSVYITDVNNSPLSLSYVKAVWG
jgi:hypothetical protein